MITRSKTTKHSSNMLLDLPNNIFETCIWPHFKGKDVSNIRMTCKSLLFLSNSLIRKCGLEIGKDDQVPMFLVPIVTTLIHASPSKWPSKHHFTSLVEFHLEFPKKMISLSPIKHCSKLEKFTIWCSSDLDKPHFSTISYLAFCKSISSVILENTVVEDLNPLRSLPSLQTLHIFNHFKNEAEPHILMGLECLTQVTNLEVNIHMLAHIPHSVKRLVLHANFRGVTDLSDMPTNMSALNFLKVYDFRHTVDTPPVDGLQEFATREELASTLRTLDLSETSGMGFNGNKGTVMDITAFMGPAFAKLKWLGMPRNVQRAPEYAHVVRTLKQRGTRVSE